MTALRPMASLIVASVILIELGRSGFNIGLAVFH
jgi:hypothetical protein